MQNRTISYKRISRACSLLFIPILLAPLLGLSLFQDSDWWMFFSCLIAYIIQFLASSVFVGGPRMNVFTINVEEIERQATIEKNVLYVYYGLIILASILDLFPLFAMSETIMGCFFSNRIIVKTYEGGFLVFLLIVLILIYNVFTALAISAGATDIFEVKEKFVETGLTPTEQLEKEKRISKQSERDKLKYEKEKYGEGYKVISRNLKFYINEHLQKLYIEKKEYSFKDILDFSIEDNAHTMSSGSTSISNANTGSMLGRAAVGGIIAGNVGAIVGGSTASRTIETSGSYSTVIHDYSIIITINSLSSPIITLNVGQDQDLVNKIRSILTVIMKRNNA